MADAGFEYDFVQDNQSLATQVGTVRGLHFQAPPDAQDKPVRCGRGALFDVAVDIRVGSTAYGRWLGVELSADNGRQLLVPRGFLHGFITRAPDTEILYKCTEYYAPECDGTVRWDDPHVGIDSGVAQDAAILSGKDATAMAFAAFQSPFRFEG